MPNKRKSSDDIAKSALARAKAMKEVAEQNVRDQLVESFAPQLKKMISNSILELDEEDDFELEDELSEEEGEGEADEVDPEDLEDLENALDEGGEEDEEEFNFEGGEESFDDEEALEEPAEDEELEEASSDYEDMEEESDEDFMAELRAILEEAEEEEEEEEELSDVEPEEEPEALKEEEGKKNGDSFDQDAPPETYHTKKYESNDGGSHTEDGGETSYHTKKYEDVLEENKRLRRALEEINSSLNETVLDEFKTQQFTRLVKQSNISESAKLRVMKAIDEGKTEKEVKRIAEVFEKTLPKKKGKKRKLKESKGGRNSSIRKPKKSKKSLKENKKPVDYKWATRLAELADIKK